MQKVHHNEQQLLVDEADERLSDIRTQTTGTEKQNPCWAIE